MTLHHRFALFFSFGVLSISLLLGVWWGLTQEQPALAGVTRSSLGWKPKWIVTPTGFTIFPIGEAVEINGSPAETAFFRASGEVPALAKQIVSEWDRRGWRSFGIALSQRATAFSIDPATGVRFSLAMWEAEDGSAEGILGAAQQGALSQRTRFIPGIAYPRSAKLGAVFHSTELSEPSWTATFTAPESPASLHAFYRSTFRDWRLIEHSGGFAEYARAEQVLTLLIVPVPGNQYESFATVIMRGGMRE